MKKDTRTHSARQGDAEVRTQAVPSVRLRRCQESTLGMVECPLLTCPSVHSWQYPSGECRRGMFRRLAGGRAGCCPAARRQSFREEILTRGLRRLSSRQREKHGPSPSIPRSVTVTTTVRHCGYHGDGSWCTPSGAYSEAGGTAEAEDCTLSDKSLHRQEASSSPVALRDAPAQVAAENACRKSLPDGDWNTCKSNSGMMASTWSKTSDCTRS